MIALLQRDPLSLQKIELRMMNSILARRPPPVPRGLTLMAVPDAAEVAALCDTDAPSVNTLVVRDDRVEGWTTDAAILGRLEWERAAILGEEAFLGQTADTLSGSYAVEVLTHTIAEKAWAMFQSKWKAL